MSRTDEALKLHKHTVKASSSWWDLIVLGDLHIGQKACNERGIIDMVSWIKSKPPSKHGVVLTGDLIENVLPTSKGSTFEMAHPDPEDQMDIATEILEPIKKYIVLMVDGNHENRTTNVSGMKPTKLMAERLGVPYYGYRSMVNLEIQYKRTKTNYMSYIEHGCGSIPKKIGGRYNKLAAMADSVVADLYIKGHIHHKLAFPRMIWKQDGNKMISKKVMFASNGSYLEDAEYAIRAGYDPCEPGVAKIRLGASKYDIHASI